MLHATIVENVARSEERMELVVDESETEEFGSVDVDENEGTLVDFSISKELPSDNIAGAKELTPTVLEDERQGRAIDER